MAAIVSEVTGSLSLKAALTSPIWYLLVGVGFLSAFVWLSFALHAQMPLGVAYGIWGASGVALTAIMSALLFNELLTPLMLAGIGLIMLGVLTIEVGSYQAAKKKEAI